MGDLFRNTRFYIIFFAGLLAVVIYFFVRFNYGSDQLQIIRLTQFYALTAVTFLYAALLIGPLSHLVHGKFIQDWLHARRGLGVSSFFFALLHGLLAFFGQLGGFAGLSFLSDYYFWGIIISFSALLILSVMALTAFDSVIAQLKYKRWKMIHRLVYLAGVLILIHALMLGTHFHDLSETIPLIFFVGVTFLFLLHALCWEKRLKRFYSFPQFGVLSFAVFVGMSMFHLAFMNPQNKQTESPLSVHNQHQGSSNILTSANQGLYMPGMEGDRNKRYRIDLDFSEPIPVKQNVLLTFTISDASNGDPVYFFQTPFEKPFHLIIVNSDLSYFSHIHPEQKANSFVIETSFPGEDLYHLYSDFQPFGAVEQQFGFQIAVGNGKTDGIDSTEVSFEKEVLVDDYKVRLDHPILLSEQLSLGKQELRFTIYDNNESPVTSLHPYLGSFGHLVMIKKDTFEYVHAHPVMTKMVRPNERSGPEVRFVPMAIYGKITPGIYRVFGQFNPNGTIITAGFWVEVK